MPAERDSARIELMTEKIEQLLLTAKQLAKFRLIFLPSCTGRT
jgi:hypothetical protein